MITEKNIINLFLYNTQYRSKTVSCISKDLFDDVNCAEIFELITNYYNEYSYFPVENIEILIMNNPWNQDPEIIREKIKIIQDTGLNYKMNDIQVFLDQTESWYKTQSFGVIMRDNLDKYINKKNINYTQIKEKLKDIESFTFKSEQWLDVFDIEGIIEDINAVENRLEFNNPILNIATGGGLPLKSVNVILGGTHTGKTRALVSLATDLAKKNKDGSIMYLTLEINDKDTRINLFANLMNESHEKIKNDSNTNRQKLIERAMELKKEYGNLLVNEFRADTCTPALIRAYIEKEMLRGNKIKAVFIDYLQLMIPNGKWNSTWEKGNNLVKEVRSISQDFEVPIFTAAQPTREGAKKAQSGVNMDLYDIGESRGISESCDFLMCIIETEEMIKEKTQRFKILKNRSKNSKNISILSKYENDIYRINFNGINDGSIVDNEQSDINNNIIKNEIENLINSEVKSGLDVI